MKGVVMVTIYKHKSCWRLQFSAPDGKRQTLYIGDMPRRAAEKIAWCVRELLACRIANTTPSMEVSNWLASLSDELRNKLARAGLVDLRPTTTLGEFVHDLIAERAKTLKPSTIQKNMHAAKLLFEFFGEQRKLITISRDDAGKFRDFLASRKLRPMTIRLWLQISRMFFIEATRRGLLDTNPFEHVRYRTNGAMRPREYVPVETIEYLMEYCPNDEWRLLLALTRYAGLRTPSETLALKWADIDFARNRIVVPVSKLEHLPNRAYRAVPLFPLVKKRLDPVWQAAEAGSEFVLQRLRPRTNGKYDWLAVNLRNKLRRIVRRAGIAPWPRLFHALRSSCESDLVRAFPLPVVAKWLGNTPVVAMNHYVDATDVDFQRAATWVPTNFTSNAEAITQRNDNVNCNVANGSNVTHDDATLTTSR